MAKTMSAKELAGRVNKVIQNVLTPKYILGENKKKPIRKKSGGKVSRKK